MGESRVIVGELLALCLERFTMDNALVTELGKTRSEGEDMGVSLVPPWHKLSVKGPNALGLIKA